MACSQAIAACHRLNPIIRQELGLHISGPGDFGSFKLLVVSLESLRESLLKNLEGLQESGAAAAVEAEVFSLLRDSGQFTAFFCSCVSTSADGCSVLAKDTANGTEALLFLDNKEDLESGCAAFGSTTCNLAAQLTLVPNCRNCYSVEVGTELLNMIHLPLLRDHNT